MIKRHLGKSIVGYLFKRDAGMVDDYYSSNTSFKFLNLIISIIWKLMYMEWNFDIGYIYMCNLGKFGCLKTQNRIDLKLGKYDVPLVVYKQVCDCETKQWYTLV